MEEQNIRRRLFTSDQDLNNLVVLTIRNTLADLKRDKEYLTTMGYDETTLAHALLRIHHERWLVIATGDPIEMKKYAAKVEGISPESHNVTHSPKSKFTLALLAVAQRGRPLVEVALNPTLKYQTFYRVCAICKRGCAQKCSACGIVFYCGERHQKEHWSTHKTACVKINQSQRLRLE